MWPLFLGAEKKGLPTNLPPPQVAIWGPQPPEGRPLFLGVGEVRVLLTSSADLLLTQSANLPKMLHFTFPKVPPTFPKYFFPHKNSIFIFLLLLALFFPLYAPFGSRNSIFVIGQSRRDPRRTQDKAGVTLAGFVQHKLGLIPARPTPALS